MHIDFIPIDFLQHIQREQPWRHIFGINIQELVGPYLPVSIKLITRFKYNKNMEWIIQYHKDLYERTCRSTIIYSQPIASSISFR